MQLIDNIRTTVKDNLTTSIRPHSKISLAAACFSIYAYKELKEQLEGIDELRFILPRLHSYLKRPLKLVVSFISHACRVSAACSAPNLR